MKWLTAGALCAAVLAWAAAAPLSAQGCSGCAQSSAAAGNRAAGQTPEAANRSLPQTSSQTAGQHGGEKWQQIQRDTERLAQLSKELQALVDKTDKGKLSMEVIRKADEIERLSKSIRERMRQN